MKVRSPSSLNYLSYPQDGTYVDERMDYIHNEVACDYNAAFSGALAALVELS